MTRTVDEPTDNGAECGGQFGQPCGAYMSPTRTIGMLFTSTLGDPATEGRGGKQPCPEHTSPSRVAMGMLSPVRMYSLNLDLVDEKSNG